MATDSPPPLLPGKKTSKLAIWSLVLGCLGVVLLVVCVGPLFAIPAVICGHLAYSRIKRSAGSLSGDGLALAGLITGYISIGLSVFILPVMFAIAVPNFVKARQSAQQMACVNNLRLIEGAKQRWAIEKGKSDEDIPSPQELTPYLGKGFASLRCPLGGTYTIHKVGEPVTCSVPDHRLPATAPQR